MGIRAGLHGRFHDARSRLFISLLQPAAGASLLDLGGGDGSLAARIADQVPLRVTVADLSADHRAGVVARGFHHVVVPAEGALPFDENQFDYVLCNSVIEHATLPKPECRTDRRVSQTDWRCRARAAQQNFAAEIARVGRGYFVQTPHRHFPVDQHVHLPFVQYLSHNAACRVVRWSDRYWIKSCHGVVDWELFTPSELAALLPDGHVYVERFLGIPKSIVVWKRP